MRLPPTKFPRSSTAGKFHDRQNGTQNATELHRHANMHYTSNNTRKRHRYSRIGLLHRYLKSIFKHMCSLINLSDRNQSRAFPVLPSPWPSRWRRLSIVRSKNRVSVRKRAQINCLFNYYAQGGLLSERKSSETSQTGN